MPHYQTLSNQLMKRVVNLLLLLATVFTLQAQKETKVLFIGIDGVRSDALIQAYTPNMDSIFQQGTYTYTSWHLRTTVSGPSWSAMLTGVWQEKHGVWSNNYTNPNWNNYPYFVTRVKEFRPDAKAAQITSWAPMSTQVYNDGWDQKVVLPSDDDCVAAAISILENDPDIDILFVHIDDVDAAGHGNQFNPNNQVYMNAIEYVDVQVGQIWNALKARPNFNNEDWVMMLTTDHGGTGSGHGGSSKEEREIWWVAWGNNGAITQRELYVDLTNLGTADYLLPDADDFDEAPLLVDIAVTAIDHLLPTVDPDTVTRWDLDGKSWLNREISSGLKDNKPAITSGKLFPNPTAGVFHLEMQNVRKELTYHLIDLNGAVVESGSRPFTKSSFDLVFDLTKQPAGVYLLQIVHDGVAQTNRVVKK